MLTPKQKKFCQEYIKCGNQTEAYKQAYGCKDWKPETITKRASELMQNGDIQGRIAELQQKVEKKDILSSQQLQEELTRYILDEKEEECIVTEGVGKGFSKSRLMNKKVAPKDKLKAIELLAKIAGYDNSEKVAPITINFTRNYD